MPKPVSLDAYRRTLDLPAVIARLCREGYEEGAVRRTLSKVRIDRGNEATMAELLVGTRRQLDVESRTSVVRRR